MRLTWLLVGAMVGMRQAASEAESAVYCLCDRNASSLVRGKRVEDCAAFGNVAYVGSLV
jgi:hypothetical protein